MANPTRPEQPFGHNDAVKIEDPAHPMSGKTGVVLGWFWHEAEQLWYYQVRIHATGQQSTLPAKSLAKHTE